MNVLLLSGSPKTTGATAELIEIIRAALAPAHEVQTVCLGECTIAYCLGCRVCHETAACVQTDNVQTIMRRMEEADRILIASPSYWADITGQLKVFFDRCTPYCNTHEPHARLSAGKKAFAAAIRTGSSSGECKHIIDSIGHFFGHLEIPLAGEIFFTGITDERDIFPHRAEIEAFARTITQ
ncbi:MAG: flavodoxin family protein [Oscillospiraceae bacterium]